MSGPWTSDAAAETAAAYIKQIGGQRKRKVSVTVDESLWEMVEGDAKLRGLAVSALVEEALALRTANFQLRLMLDETYEENPAARPSEEMIEQAGRILDGTG